MAKSASVTRALGALLLTGLVLATSLGDPVTVAAASAPSQREMLGWLRTLGAPVLDSALDVVRENSLVDGSDGRLTVMVLGTDTRNSGWGLTDVILIASIDQATNQVSLASIPRDIGKFPNPNGGTYVGKVNNLVKKIGLTSFERAVEYTLDIEIDYNVLITFRGFETMVDNVDGAGIIVSNPKQIADPKFWDDPNKPKGVYFPTGPNTLYALPGGPLCNGLWRTRGTSSTYWCHRALPFVRSRKGSGNSDFVRAKRQQSFLWGALGRVLSRGSGAALESLAATARGQVGIQQIRGTLPTTYAAAASLFSELSNATLPANRQIVFAPNTYATKIPNTSSYQLKLTAVRAWTAAYMN